MSMFFRPVQTRAMATLVKTTLQDGVQLIGINRAAKKNCINHETAHQLISAFEKFENDENAKIAVLYGEGGVFCAGYDLSEVSKGNVNVEDGFLPKYRYMGPTAMKLKKPLIAAVEGYAVAGGLELSLLADLRVAGKSSTFGVFCRRVGVPLIDGGTVRLTRIVGAGRALDMVLTGRAVSAEEALGWGLVNRVVEDGQAVAYATKLAKEVISHPYACMLADRESMYHAMDNDFDTAMLKELESFSVIPQAIAGAQKFIDKKISPPSKL